MAPIARIIKASRLFLITARLSDLESVAEAPTSLLAHLLAVSVDATRAFQADCYEALLRRRIARSNDAVALKGRDPEFVQGVQMLKLES